MSRDILDNIINEINTDYLDDCVDSEWNAIHDAIKESRAAVHVFDIEWDINPDDFDSEAEYNAVIENVLPKELYILVSKLRNVKITDYLTDNYGYLVKNYQI